MSLPIPNLDDRRFQDLVDDAKRLVQQRCPEWTDHNVSDPGVTMIELHAWMTDQLLYRLNRVPERMYLTFLELIGVRLFPPRAAQTDVTFWLSAPQPEVVRVPAGTEIASPRTDAEDAVTFTTSGELAIVPCSLAALATQPAGGQARKQLAALESGRPFVSFGEVPEVGDALLVGLVEPVPSCAVALRFDCEIEGIGVDPRNPPLLWEAWDGDGWVPCEVERDETGGLNRAGDVVLHVPATHEASLVAGRRAGWLRCRVVSSADGDAAYSSSPRIRSLSAFTIGGTAPATHAHTVAGEVLGVSEGVPGQRFSVEQPPLLPEDAPRVLEVATDDGWQDWSEVATFAASAPDDRHFVVDAVAGEVALGPGVREADGSLRTYGAVPPKGAVVRLRSYRSGGGRRGNVARRTLTILKSAIPYVSSVENRRPAHGGVDGEELENAKLRGPFALRTGDRAVTAEDYEQLAREAAPDVARVRCLPAGDGADAGGVRVLVVPATAADTRGPLRFEQLIPTEEALERIARHLDERRVIGARVAVSPPVYQGVTVVARVRPRAGTDARQVHSSAVEALHRYFHPLHGGPEGSGWPFGRTAHVGEVYSVLQRVPEVDLVEDGRLFAADPTTGERGEAVDRVEIAPHALVFCYEPQVLVEAG